MARRKKRTPEEIAEREERLRRGREILEHYQALDDKLKAERERREREAQ